MDFELSEELLAVREMARDFAAEKIAPFADKWDEEHYFPYREVIKPMAELGFFGTVLPEEYGGNNMGWMAAMILTEEIARASSSLRVQINMQALGCAFTIYRYGSDVLETEIYRQPGQCRLSGRIRHHRTQRRIGCHVFEIHGRRQR